MAADLEPSASPAKEATTETERPIEGLAAGAGLQGKNAETKPPKTIADRVTEMLNEESAP
jgi:hypothetical protein